MTKKIEYKCNLCNEAIPDQAAGEALYWVAQAHGRSKAKFRKLPEAEHHICNNCINDIWEQKA